MEPSPDLQPEQSRWANRTGRSVLFWLIMILLAVVLWKMASPRQASKGSKLSYSAFLSQVDNKNVRQVIVYPAQNTAEVRGRLKDSGGAFYTTIPAESLPALTSKLRSQGVEVEISRESKRGWLSSPADALPLILLAVLWMLVMLRKGRRGRQR